MPLTERQAKTLIYAAVALVWVAVMVAVLTMCSGSDDAESQPATVAVSDSVVVAAISHNSRLYTAEAEMKKTITYSSKNSIGITVGGITKSIHLPLGNTTASIPVTVKYKAYIDLDKITERNIHIINDSTIHITLPDPVIVETAATIDYDNYELKQQLFGAGITDQQMRHIILDAKQKAWLEMDDGQQRAIVETAKVSATDLLLPQLKSLGFTAILIDYRKGFSPSLFRQREAPLSPPKGG